MTTLAIDKTRSYEFGNTDMLPMVADDIIYEGAAVGDDGNGLARPLVAGDAFLGFAKRRATNAGGAAGAIRVEVRLRGEVELDVVGVSSNDDLTSPVYASDDNTFTLTAGSNTFIGRVARWRADTRCLVSFESSVFGSLGGAGGATAFTDLTDCPATITAGALLVGNAAGDGVVQAPGFVVIDDGVPAAGKQLTAICQQVDGRQTVATIGLEAGYAQLDLYAQNATGDVYGELTIQATPTGVLVTGLPTSDPAVANALWNDAGTLKISAG